MTHEIPTRCIDGKWHLHNGQDWRPVRNELVVAILDEWPEATVTMEAREE